MTFIMVSLLMVHIISCFWVMLPQLYSSDDTIPKDSWVFTYVEGFIGDVAEDMTFKDIPGR